MILLSKYPQNLFIHERREGGFVIHALLLIGSNLILYQSWTDNSRYNDLYLKHYNKQEYIPVDDPRKKFRLSFAVPIMPRCLCPVLGRQELNMSKALSSPLTAARARPLQRWLIKWDTHSQEKQPKKVTCKLLRIKIQRYTTPLRIHTYIKFYKSATILIVEPSSFHQS